MTPHVSAVGPRRSSTEPPPSLEQGRLNVAPQDPYTASRNALLGLLGGVCAFLEKLDQPVTTQADEHAVGLVHTAYAHARGVHELSRIDVGLLLPAAAAARSSYEAAIKAAWLVKPTEPLERERRAAGYLAEEERFLRQISTDFQTSGAATAAARTLAVADGLAVALALVKHQLSEQLANPAPVALPVEGQKPLPRPQAMAHCSHDQATRLVGAGCDRPRRIECQQRGKPSSPADFPLEFWWLAPFEERFPAGSWHSH
jgi:hypothetical protein